MRAVIVEGVGSAEKGLRCESALCIQNELKILQKNADESTRVEETVDETWK